MKINSTVIIFPKGVRQAVDRPVRNHQRQKEWDSYLPIPSDSMIVPVSPLSHRYLISSVQRSFFTGTSLDGGRLGHRDLINHETDTTFRDDIRDGVSELDVDLDRVTLDAEHGEDVDDGVGTPRNDGPPLNTLDKVTDMRITFTVGGITESNEKSVDNVDERDHSTTPIRPPGTETVGIGDEFTGVTQDNHESGSDTQRSGLRLGFIGWKFHHQNDFNQ
mmetsp:Transcript_53293/g.60650  ORF Transcript_53293/g.60650 Transcript_53293/m.60650 type:complete len:219 (-) Transcript_53293:354-1010(-)